MSYIASILRTENIYFPASKTCFEILIPYMNSAFKEGMEGPGHVQESFNGQLSQAPYMLRQNE